jgi:peptidoglycan-associated lipoprotein
VISLRANPATIDRGTPTTLEWEARNAATVRIEPGVGDVTVTGRREINPTSSVTYTATATGPGGTDQAVARVTVNIPPAPPTEDAPRVRADLPTSLDDSFRQNVQTIFFDYDKAEIRPDQIQRLQANATWLRQNATARFTIEGHCDDRGSQEYNLALGDHRANVVKDFLVAQGIAATRINVISYGEERPSCREETEDCFQKNRRADFLLNPNP